MTTRRTAAALGGSIASAALLAGSVLGGTAVASVGSTTAEAATTSEARPSFQVPFRCGPEWRADTRADHSPSSFSVDFNRGSGDDDLGRVVLASASGTVSKVARASGYGNYLVVSHPNGWSTLYAHLQDGSIEVTEGQRVYSTTIIGKVGATGQVSAAHLHYEQRLDGEVQRAVLGGKAVTYYASPGPNFARPC
jgi:hypothetical protein